MAYRDQQWSDRVTTLGDESESRFETWAKRQRRGYVRFGLNRPPIRVYELPTRLRHVPDFLTSKSFVECQGLGSDGIVKMKLSKHGCLRWWNDLLKVELYLWDSKLERECILDLDRFDQLLGTATLDSFDNLTKPYFALNADRVFAAAAEVAA